MVIWELLPMGGGGANSKENVDRIGGSHGTRVPPWPAIVSAFAESLLLGWDVAQLPSSVNHQLGGPN